jgi:hypothetical protein
MLFQYQIKKHLPFVWIPFFRGIQITKFLQTFFKNYRYLDKLSKVASQIWNHLPKKTYDIPQGSISLSKGREITDIIVKMDETKRATLLDLLPGDQEESLPGGYISNQTGQKIFDLLDEAISASKNTSEWYCCPNQNIRISSFKIIQGEWNLLDGLQLLAVFGDESELQQRARRHCNG